MKKEMFRGNMPWRWISLTMSWLPADTKYNYSSRFLFVFRRQFKTIEREIANEIEHRGIRRLFIRDLIEIVRHAAVIEEYFAGNSSWKQKIEYNWLNWMHAFMFKIGLDTFSLIIPWTTNKFEVYAWKKIWIKNNL